MRRSRLTDERTAAVLRVADRTSAAEAARKHEVSAQTLHVWRKHCAGLAPADAKDRRRWSRRTPSSSACSPNPASKPT